MTGDPCPQVCGQASPARTSDADDDPSNVDSDGDALGDACDP
ncbi:MAG: hypothetical protein ABMB14_23705 [Myxococcota bacterium]